MTSPIDTFLAEVEKEKYSLFPDDIDMLITLIREMKSALEPVCECYNCGGCRDKARDTLAYMNRLCGEKDE